jgi:hypothetical protein
MKKNILQFWKKGLSQEKNVTPKSGNFIKIKEACELLKASAPTVRKYARLGCYKTYRFGDKLVFYNRNEIMHFIHSKPYVKKS